MKCNWSFGLLTMIYTGVQGHKSKTKKNGKNKEASDEGRESETNLKQNDETINKHALASLRSNFSDYCFCDILNGKCTTHLHPRLLFLFYFFFIFVFYKYYVIFYMT
ncbi:hypothetical protein ABFX02_05G061500 [Erythranthe guttata]